MSLAAVQGASAGSALASTGTSSYHIFGISPGGDLHQDTWSGSWAGWQDLGNPGPGLTGSPGVAYNGGDGSYHAFVLAGNGQAYQETYTPSAGWGSWQSLGGDFQSGFSAVYVPANGTYHVFGISPGGALHEDTWSGSWTGWQDLGNPGGITLTGSPGVAYNGGDGSYHAFALGSNGQTYQETYTPSAGWGSWQNLGGTLQGGISAVYIPTGCAADNSCTPKTFADAVLSYPGVGGAVTASNEYAIETWATAEEGGAGCPGQPANTAPWANSAGPAGNPLNTKQTEPGSSNWNSGGVQIYANADGETCWFWGIEATAVTLTNGRYANVLAVLASPASSDHS